MNKDTDIEKKETWVEVAASERFAWFDKKKIADEVQAYSEENLS